jgi:hypothetical protein
VTPLHIGYTGTQRGMTGAQAEAVAKLLCLHGTCGFVGHHGDCVGGDAQFDALARLAPGFDRMHIYPCTITEKRAYCTPVAGRDVVYYSRAPLDRNHDIVHAVTYMIAAPKSMHEELRSGTWTTVRYARKAGKPIAVVFPNGAVVYDGPAWPRSPVDAVKTAARGASYCINCGDTSPDGAPECRGCR